MTISPSKPTKYRTSISSFKQKCLLLSLVVAFCSATALTAAAQPFTDMSGSVVANDGKGSRSVAFVDYNNDGYLDLFVTNGKSGGENNMLYLNNQDGTFSVVDTGAIVTDHRSSDGATFGDYDNDGFLDCFVSNWYNQNNLLYHNSNEQAWVLEDGAEPASNGGYSEAASWADYDNDGDLDLFVANSSGDLRNFLFRNDDTGFVRILDGPIATDAVASRCGVWGDYDNDGDLDLFVANEFFTNNSLYENQGDGSFIAVTTGPVVTTPANSWGASWGDIDNDLDLDLFVTNSSGQNNHLFRNDGGGNFTQLFTAVPSLDMTYSVSSAWVDFDNDADLDLFVASGWGASAPNLFYINDGAGNFTKVTDYAITADTGWAYGCAWGDYDRDGDQDLVVARWMSETENNDLFRNDTGSVNNWLNVNCVGVVSNNSGIGAKVKVKAIVSGVPVWQMHEVSSQTSYCSQNSLNADIGLGDASEADSLVIEWPSGIVDIYTSIAANQYLNAVEGAQLCSDTDFDRDGYTEDSSGTTTCPLDNCPTINNHSQADADGDNIGDVCDACPSDPNNDADGDGFCADVDNCPIVYNPLQEDTDNDGIGDACCCLLRGDIDNSTVRDITDLTYFVDFFFSGGPTAPCPSQGDVDGGGSVDIADLTFFVEFLFSGGPEPVGC